MQLITIFFFDPFLNLLILLIKLFDGNMGLAIIALTILFRLVVLPLNWKSLHSQRKMQQLKPHLDVIKAKHKDDKAAFSQAQMDLYKEHGISPIGGCLPMLLQLPFLFGVYRAMQFMVDLKTVGELNSHLYVDWLHIQQLSDIHLQFGWLNLAHPDPWFVLPVLAGVSQFILSRMMLPPKEELPKPETPKEASLEQSMASAQRQMVYFFPIMTFLLAWRFSAGLSLYWTVGNLFSIIQQFYVNKALPHPTPGQSVGQPVAPAAESTEAKPKPKAKKKKNKK
jgi:YidC/Oxa1 family membrane protein insertase